MTDLTASKQLAPIDYFNADLGELFSSPEMAALDEKAKGRLRNAANVAVTKDPEILTADPASILMAIRQCANYGVLPDGVEATIQIYYTKVKDRQGVERSVKKATLMPMIRGIVNRVERSGKIRPFHAEVVYDGEAFSLDLSHGDRRPSHTFDPMRRGKDAQIVGAYSVARYSDGVVDCEVMPRSEIDKVMAVAKTKNVWNGWYSEKAKVAVMKRHSKRLPLSSEDMDFILNRDETDFEQVRDITPEPQANRVNLAQRLSSPPKTAPTPENIAQDGEVVSEQPEAAQSEDAASLDESMGSDGFPGSGQWTEGARAFADGKGINACPYDPATQKQQAADWLGGWSGARRSAE